jgi:hypothetical protein
MFATRNVTAEIFSIVGAMHGVYLGSAAIGSNSVIEPLQGLPALVPGVATGPVAVHQTHCFIDARSAWSLLSGIGILDWRTLALPYFPKQPRLQVASPRITHERFRKALVVAYRYRGANMRHFLCELWLTDDGQDIAEYADTLAVILVLVGTVHLVGSNAKAAFSGMASSLQ